MKIAGIYCLTNTINGKRYVGQSVDIIGRWKQHAKALDKIGLGGAVAKHGWAAFTAEVLERCEPELMNERECYWIAKLGTTSPSGYNLTTGGSLRKAFTDDARAFISARTKAGLTPEVLERRNQAMRGIPKSPEWRAMMSERQKSAANVARLAEMARNQSEETKKKISAAHMGKAVSQETCALLSKIAKESGRAAHLHAHPNSRSEQARAKMSAAAKLRVARSARNEDGKFA